jgi:hypothetical protein
MGRFWRPSGRERTLDRESDRRGTPRRKARAVIALTRLLNTNEIAGAAWSAGTMGKATVPFAVV